MNTEIQLNFYNFYFEETTIKNFEEWLYASSSHVEDQLGEEFYFNLIELNYSKKKDIEKAKKLIEGICNNNKPDLLIKLRILHVLNNILNGTQPLSEGCDYIGNLGFDGYDFIPDIFEGLHGELSSKENEDFYKDMFLKAVKEFRVELMKDIANRDN